VSASLGQQCIVAYHRSPLCVLCASSMLFHCCPRACIENAASVPICGRVTCADARALYTQSTQQADAPQPQAPEEAAAAGDAAAEGCKAGRGASSAARCQGAGRCQQQRRQRQQRQRQKCACSFLAASAHGRDEAGPCRGSGGGQDGGIFAVSSDRLVCAMACAKRPHQRPAMHTGPPNTCLRAGTVVCFVLDQHIKMRFVLDLHTTLMTVVHAHAPSSQTTGTECQAGDPVSARHAAAPQSRRCIWRRHRQR
jgi:hypothetical protein